MKTRIMGEMSKKLEEAKDYKPVPQEWLSSKWKGFKSPEQMARIRSTGRQPSLSVSLIGLVPGVKIEILQKVGKQITTIDPSITPHRLIKKVYQQRNEMITKRPLP